MNPVSRIDGLTRMRTDRIHQWTNRGIVEGFKRMEQLVHRQIVRFLDLEVQDCHPTSDANLRKLDQFSSGQKAVGRPLDESGAEG